MSARILVVADGARETGVLRALLVKPEFLPRFEVLIPHAVECARSWRPQVALVDLGVPRSGEMVKALRGESPLIFLLYAPTQRVEMMTAMEEGAISALAKPFVSEELLVRLRALVRHLPILSPAVEPVTLGALSLDARGRRVLVAGRPVELTPKEFDILMLIAASAGRVLTRRHILEAVWGYDSAISPRAVDWHISRLRKKLGNRVSRAVVVVSGRGYALRPSELAWGR